METQAFLNVQQLADRLNTKPRMIYRLVDERRIPFYKIGKHLRFDPTEVDSFITSCRVAETRRPLAGL